MYMYVTIHVYGYITSIDKNDWYKTLLFSYYCVVNDARFRNESTIFQAIQVKYNVPL